MSSVMKKKQLTSAALAKEAAKWLRTEEGRSASDAAIKDAKDSALEIKQAREVDYAAMHTPFNI
jgi:hypothetical protein